MVDLMFPLTYRENANLIYAISFFYTLLVSVLIWSIWRFIKAILSLKTENIKLKAEERLAKHYAEIRRFKQIEQKRELNQNICEGENQKEENIPETRKPKKNLSATKKRWKTKIKNVEKGMNVCFFCGYCSLLFFLVFIKKTYILNVFIKHKLEVILSNIYS